MKRSVAFVAGPPVRGDNFFGRKRTLHSLVHRLESGISTLLVGQRRIGKSSVLAQLRYLHERNQLARVDSSPIVVYLDGYLFSGHDAADDLARALVESARRSAKEQRPSASKSLDRQTRAEVTSRWEALDFFDGLRRDGLSLLLLLDEVDAALAASGGETGLVLRSLISQGHVVAICTSFAWPDEIQVEVGASSPWFNLFQLDPLGLFEVDESIEMLRVLSGRSGYELSERECLFLIDVLGNNPFYLQTAGYRLYADHGYASLEDSERLVAMRETLTGFPRDMELHLRYLVEHLTPADVEALTLAARGEDTGDVRTMARLSRLGLIHQNAERWEVSSGMIREFIAALPRPSMAEKVRGSGPWKAFNAIAHKAVDVAIEKAVEVATGKYLG